MELVENIVLHMPIRDILISAMRVCKLWKKIVGECPEIQQALFLRPVEGGFVKMFSYEVEGLEEDGESPNRELSTGEQGCFWAHDDYGPAVEVMRNPLLHDVGEPRGVHGKFVKRSRRWIGRRGEAFGRDEASWRRMFVTQPPVRRITAEVDYRFRYVHSWFLSCKLYIYTNPDGIKLGELDLPRRSWRSGLEGAKFTPETGDEVVRIEKTRPEVKAVTEEPEDLSGVDDWSVVDLGLRTVGR